MCDKGGIANQWKVIKCSVCDAKKMVFHMEAK